MIHALDLTLQELFKQGMPKSLVEQVTISFVAPDNQFPPTNVILPAIDLFLYDIRENRELRGSEWQMQRSETGSVVRQTPPTRVDCSYLITAWPSQNTPNPAYDEHRLLGEVMRTLLRFTTIPRGILQGELADSQLPLPTTSLQAGKLQSLAEFWQAMGGKPKAVLNYSVTIAVPVHEPEEIGLPVLDKQVPGWSAEI